MIARSASSTGDTVTRVASWRVTSDRVRESSPPRDRPGRPAAAPFAVAVVADWRAAPREGVISRGISRRRASTARAAASSAAFNDPETVRPPASAAT